MSSDRKKEAARANGAKSRGPKTPEGKAKSSRNAVRHGFNAKIAILDNESEEEFNRLRDAYIAELSPRNQVEADLVDQIVVARWRLQRIWAMETSLINAEVIKQRRRIEQEFTHIDEASRIALAFKAEVDNSHALALLNRYEIRDQRTIRRTLETLRRLRQEDAKQTVQNEPNEPVLPPPAASAKMAPAKTGQASLSQAKRADRPASPPFRPLEIAPTPDPGPETPEYVDGSNVPIPVPVRRI